MNETENMASSLDFIPTGHPDSSLLMRLTVPPNWQVSSQESKQAGRTLTANSPETKRLRLQKIAVIASETVVYIYSKDLDEDGLDAVENDLSTLAIVRTIRSAILTQGSFQLKATPSWIPNLFAATKIPNVKFGILDLRSVHMSRDVLMLAYVPTSDQATGSSRQLSYAMYQAQEPNRLLNSFVSVIVAAYVGMPNWAIPISWSGDLPSTLTPVSDQQHDEWVGSDGGFSSYFYSAIVGFHVQEKLPLPSLIVKGGRQGLARSVSSQQPPQPSSVSNLSIDLMALVQELIHDNRVKNRSIAVDEFVRRGLEGLAFNLIFRQLRVNNYRPTMGKATFDFRSALAMTLRYNVTLRTVDLSRTALTGMGSTLGRALEGNVHPLLAKLNLSCCELTNDDLMGLLPGLMRIWCGSEATTFVESIQLRENRAITTGTWNLFFLGFVEYSTAGQDASFTSLRFLQDLDLWKTRALGTGLVQFLQECSGLRRLSLSIDEAAKNYSISQFLPSLISLEELEAENLNSSSVGDPSNFGNKLKAITLHGFSGQVSPIICSWPNPVPNLNLVFRETDSVSSFEALTDIGVGYSPGSLSFEGSSDFTLKVIRNVLSKQATGLRVLRLSHVYYDELAETAPVLAFCGLQRLHMLDAPPPTSSSWNGHRARAFWDGLALSKTLRVIEIPDQLRGDSAELAMIGIFLKTNRSVESIRFDSKYGKIDLFSVQVLRRAFYGNKKVIALDYPQKMQLAYLQGVKVETSNLLREISECKAAIKKIFKKHYRKYDRKWRNKPNALKVPYVDRIRVAKRKISQMERDSKKIASLLNEINDAVLTNAKHNKQIQREKETIQLSRRESQLQNLTLKKQKILTKLVTALHKAKQKGRRNKSAKQQLPRYVHYRKPDRWRRHNHQLYGDDCTFIPIQPILLDVTTTRDEDCRFLGNLRPYLTDRSHIPSDPWCSLDAIVSPTLSNSLYRTIISPPHLSAIHAEASELGPDVVAGISVILDEGAAVDAKLHEIAENSGIARAVLDSQVDNSLDAQMDVAMIQSTLDNLPDLDETVFDADAAIEMYAGAGPRDLGGFPPNFESPEVIVGRRRDTRQKYKQIERDRVRAATRARSKLSSYSHLNLIGNRNDELKRSVPCTKWPCVDLVQDWALQTRLYQIEAMSESDLFHLPEVVERKPKIISEWSCDTSKAGEIVIALVTQCSMDRLPNLQAQLIGWNGKASVAIYLKSHEDIEQAERSILSTLERAKFKANNLDVAISIVHGSLDEEPYPINYLRNVALLEARRQQLRSFLWLENCGVFLVDVDFVPSDNLHSMLHMPRAIRSILDMSKVLVCPAFETRRACCPTTVPALWESVQIQETEGFHLSHFPQGHSPTRFDEYWKRSLECMTGKSNPWDHVYSIEYEECFEPYIVMSSSKVPLYDERFSGYGWNKVAHLATLSQRDFCVLPGVFCVAQVHERSTSWQDRYAGECRGYNQLWLKGLYTKFSRQVLRGGEGPVVSDQTSQNEKILQRIEKDQSFVPCTPSTRNRTTEMLSPSRVEVSCA